MQAFSACPLCDRNVSPYPRFIEISTLKHASNLYDNFRLPVSEYSRNRTAMATLSMTRVKFCALHELDELLNLGVTPSDGFS